MPRGRSIKERKREARKDDERSDGKEGSQAPDSHMDWLNREKSRRTFNLGNYDIEVGQEEVVVHGKTSDEYGREKVLQRDGIEASASVVSRTPIILLYVAYALYAYAFTLLFVIDGLRVPSQLAIFGIALLLLLTPLVLYFLLPFKLFFTGSVIFFIVAFSLPEVGPLGTIFKVIEDAVGSGYVEAFLIGASLLPILLHIIVSQTIVKYRLTLRDKSNVFETISWGRSAPALVGYIEHGQQTLSHGFSFKRFFEFDLPLHFLKISRARMKRCAYCSEGTFVECNRCHAPICNSHYKTLHGHKVCLDCFVERRGKLREGLRWIDR